MIPHQTLLRYNKMIRVVDALNHNLSREVSVMQDLVIITKENLSEHFKGRPEDFDPSWERRDFVSNVCDFMKYRSGGIKIVSGLRGTGKTVGLIQTVNDKDVLYIRPLEKGKVSIDEALDVIRSHHDKSNIAIDEFTWFKEFLPPKTDAENERRDNAERAIVALSENGKNFILTGTESASLEATKGRGFIHRATDTLHVTRFSFAEFKRIYKDRLPNRPQDVYDMYLREGGVFEDYVKKSAGGMDSYIRNSIVENLYAYIGSDKGLSRQQIASGVYTVLFEAVHDIVNTTVTGEEFTEKAKANLAAMGIADVSEKLNPRTVQSISETMENIGVIIKIPNVIPREDRIDKAGLADDERTYIVNPAISYQLAKVVFDDVHAENMLLGRLMEASVIVELDAQKRSGDHVYFYENDNREVDAVIAPEYGEGSVSLFEVKHRYKISSKDMQNRTWSILSEDVEKKIQSVFPDNDIENRYFVYTGERRIDAKGDRTFLFVGIDDCLRRYWDFEGNRQIIEKESGVFEAEEDRDLSEQRGAEAEAELGTASPASGGTGLDNPDA